jgi:hypothetical protein
LIYDCLVFGRLFVHRSFGATWGTKKTVNHYGIIFVVVGIRYGEETTVDRTGTIPTHDTKDFGICEQRLPWVTQVLHSYKKKTKGAI